MAILLNLVNLLWTVLGGITSDYYWTDPLPTQIQSVVAKQLPDASCEIYIILLMILLLFLCVVLLLLLLLQVLLKSSSTFYSSTFLQSTFTFTHVLFM